MEIPTIKKTIINAVSGITDLKEIKLKDGTSFEMSGKKVIVVTSGCIISGVLPDPEDAPYKITGVSSFTYDFVTLAVETTAKKYREKHGINDELPGNDGCIVLKNAVVRYAADFTAKFDELVVFNDQILGITIADRDIG